MTGSTVVNSAICTHEFARLKKVVDEWNQDESGNFNVAYNGGTVKAFSRNLEDAVEHFLNATADAGKQVADDDKEAIMEIDRLCNAYETFKILASEESSLAPPYGSDDFWAAYRNICEHFNSRPNYQKPQSVSTLISQKVGPLQIATIYGWKKPDGAPDVDKVTDEINKPGTHYKPETWVHPAKAIKQRSIDVEWNRRTAVREANFDVRKESEPVNKFVPPSLSEMVAVGAPAKQIANVHKISVEEAEQLLIEAGTEPKREIVPANAQVARLERLMKEQNAPFSVAPVASSLLAQV